MIAPEAYFLMVGIIICCRQFEGLHHNLFCSTIAERKRDGKIAVGDEMNAGSSLRHSTIDDSSVKEIARSAIAVYLSITDTEILTIGIEAY